ncbi:hypothetical protein NHQ30_005950 [Ciborinia camelliae]|nr:hypothetical protein NHQ30_005950 [Ciborinia camelliae]
MSLRVIIKHLSLPFLALCIGSREVVAQSTEPLFAGSYPVVAYEIGSTPNVATTYLVACPAGFDTATCNFQQPYTLIEGPATVQFAMTFPGHTTIDLDCDLAGTTSMSCVATEFLPGLTKVATTTVTGDAAAARFRNISIVSNAADLLTYAVDATTTSASPSPTGVNYSAGASRTGSDSMTATTSGPMSGITGYGTAAGTGGSIPTITSVSWSSGSPTASGIAPKISDGGGFALAARGKEAVNLGLWGFLGVVGVGVWGF